MSQRLKLRARVARAFRGLSTVRGWQGLVNRCVPDHEARFTVWNSGDCFVGNIGSFVDRQMYLFGGYETAQIACFLSKTPGQRRGTILDIGANAGTHSMAFARRFNSVHAFEPNPALWSQFRENMRRNTLSNVQLHTVGLADKDALLTLYTIDKPNPGLGTFSTAEQYDLPLQAAARCSVRHAADYLQELGIQRVDAVKIDVQGFEPEVLRGLARVTARDRPVIWCEISAGTLEQIGRPQEFKSLLPRGYRCFRLLEHPGWRVREPILEEAAFTLPKGDYLLIPEEVM